MCAQIVDLPLAESIRHHLDLQKDNQNARFVQKALKFYTSLANRAVRAGCAVDIFACSLDQVRVFRERSVISGILFPVVPCAVPLVHMPTFPLGALGRCRLFNSLFFAPFVHESVHAFSCFSNWHRCKRTQKIEKKEVFVSVWR